jgi:hypothetical protein
LPAFELAPDRCLARPASGCPRLARLASDCCYLARPASGYPRLASNSKAPIFFPLHECRERELDQARKFTLQQAMACDRACPLDQITELDIRREMHAEAIGGQRFELAPTRLRWSRPPARSVPETSGNSRHFRACRLRPLIGDLGLRAGHLPDFVCFGQQSLARSLSFADYSRHSGSNRQAPNLLPYIRSRKPRGEHCLDVPASLTPTRLEQLARVLGIEMRPKLAFEGDRQQEAHAARNLAQTSPQNPTHSQHDAISRQNLVNNEMTFCQSKSARAGEQLMALRRCSSFTASRRGARSAASPQPTSPSHARREHASQRGSSHKRRTRRPASVATGNSASGVRHKRPASNGWRASLKRRAAIALSAASPATKQPLTRRCEHARRRACRHNPRPRHCTVALGAFSPMGNSAGGVRHETRASHGAAHHSCLSSGAEANQLRARDRSCQQRNDQS